MKYWRAFMTYIYILLEPYTENKTRVITQKYGEKNKKRN